MSEEAIEAIVHRLDAQDKTLARIEVALIGDPQMQQPGIASRVVSLERKQREQERTIIRWSAYATAAGFMLTHFKEKLISLFH